MVGGGEGEVVVQELFKFPSKGRCELGSAIGDDFIEKSKVKEYFVEKEGGDSFGGNGFLSRAKNYPLSKPMVYHDHERIEARGDREVRDKVTGDLLEGAGSGGLNG